MASSLSDNLAGAYRLAFGDRGGLDRIDHDLGAPWRSLSVGFAVIPVYVLMAALRLAPSFAGSDAFLAYLVAHGLGGVISWIGFLLAVAWVAPKLGCARYFPEFVTAFNYALVWQTALQAAAELINALSITGGSTGLFILVAAQVAVLVYTWQVARLGLRLRGALAHLIVLLAVAVGVAVQVLVALPFQLGGAFPGAPTG